MAADNLDLFQFQQPKLIIIMISLPLFPLFQHYLYRIISPLLHLITMPLTVV